MRMQSPVAACAAVAGVAGALAAGPARADEDVQPGRVTAHAYVNLATGEMTVTPVQGPRAGGLVWQNDDSCGYFYGVDRPTRDPATGLVRFGATVANWGDLPADTRVEGFEFAFMSQLVEVGEGCDLPPGLRVRVGFIERYDSVVSPGGPVTPPGGAGPAREVASFILGGFSVETECEPAFAGLIVTVDLEGSGREFTLGDTASGLGGDLDGDGLADFGYSYTMLQSDEPKVICGPVLVQPASLGGAGTAMGVPNLVSWFNNAPGIYDGYVRDLNFGPGDCITVPYAVTYLNLYGARPGSYCGDIDYTADGFIDFLDYLEFLNRFDAADASADLSGDGIVDFGDWLEFYNRYAACGG